MAACFAEAGAKVALVARRPEALEQAQAEIAAKAKGKVKAFPCDVTDPQQIEALFPKIESTLGPVDILVNNAGSSARAPFLEITDARSEEHTSELQSLMRISYAVFCLKKKNTNHTTSQ